MTTGIQPVLLRLLHAVSSTAMANVIVHGFGCRGLPCRVESKS